MRVSRLLAVTHWLKDDVFRRLFRNAGMLLGGDVAGSVLGLAALALTARVLGIEDFATFTLVQTYVMVLSRVVNFQSWQALIKYGAEALRQERYGDFRQLIRLGTLLDACTAVLGAGVSVAAIFWVGPWMGWDASTVRMAAIASVVILFEVVGTPVAALRLFDRFKTLAVLNVVGNAFKLAAVSVAWLSGGSIWAFVVAWLCTRLMHQTLLLLCGWTVLLRQGMGERVRDFLRRQGAGLVQLGLGRFLSYSVHASLAGTVRSVCRDSILFLVGALLGKGYVAYYKVMLGISSVLPRLARPLFDAVYPEFARAVGAGAHDKVRELSFRLNVLFSVLLASWIVPYLLVGKLFLGAVFGREYVVIYWQLFWYLGAVSVGLYTLPITARLWSLGAFKRVLWLSVAGSVVQMAALLHLLAPWQLGAVTAALLLYNVVFVLGGSLFVPAEHGPPLEPVEVS